jgi:anhydro-N-acetylmuramic acid kinase
LLHFTVRSVAASIELLPDPPLACFVSGGGRHNREMMRAVSLALAGVPVEPIEALGFDGEATEAQAFAFLAVRAQEGDPLSYPLTTGVPRPLTGGRISYPTTKG